MGGRRQSIPGSGRDKVRVRLGPSEGLKVPLRGCRGDPHAQVKLKSPEADPRQQAGQGQVWQAGPHNQRPRGRVEMTRSEAQESPREHGQVLHKTKIRALMMSTSISALQVETVTVQRRAGRAGRAGKKAASPEGLPEAALPCPAISPCTPRQQKSRIATRNPTSKAVSPVRPVCAHGILPRASPHRHPPRLDVSLSVPRASHAVVLDARRQQHAAGPRPRLGRNRPEGQVRAQRAARSTSREGRLAALGTRDRIQW